MVADRTLLRVVKTGIVAFFVLLVSMFAPPITRAVWGSNAVALGYVLVLLGCVSAAAGSLVLLNRE